MKKIMTFGVIAIGLGLLYLAYRLWPEVEINSISVFPSIIVGGIGLFSFTFTVWINEDKQEWINLVLDL